MEKFIIIVGGSIIILLTYQYFRRKIFYWWTERTLRKIAKKHKDDPKISKLLTQVSDALKEERQKDEI